MYPRILLRRAGLLLILCSAASAQYTITEYSTGLTAGSYPYGIAAGPDGALWFTEGNGNRIGRITTAGVITEFSAGLTAGSGPNGIAAGPDSALWFTEYSGRIGRITTAGVITEYSTGLTAGSGPYGIAAGPDGALWFTEYSGNRIGRIAAASQTVPTVPTLSEWGMLLLALLLAAAAGLQLHCGARRRASAPQR